MDVHYLEITTHHITKPCQDSQTVLDFIACYYCITMTDDVVPHILLKEPYNESSDEENQPERILAAC